jgi:phage-related protein
VDGYTVEFFEKEKGVFPAEQFVLSQDYAMRAKLYRLMELLEEKGNQVREPYSKHIDDGIFEIRAKQGSDITRVLYFFTSGKKIIMANGFVKKTPKTPKAEINLAKKYRTEYNNRIERKE